MTSYLQQLIDKAKGFLGKAPQLGTEMNAVEQDTYDEVLFKQMLDEAPALSEMTYNDIGYHYDYSESLVNDVFNLHWQGDPHVVDKKRMRPEGLANWQAIRQLEDDPATPALRQWTRHDKYGAAMATVGVTDAIKEFLARQKEAEEKREEATRKQREAEQAREQVEQGCGFGTGKDPSTDGIDTGEEGDGEDDGQVNGQGDGQGDPARGYDGAGPMTQEQAEAAAALAQALANAEQLSEEAAQALAEAEAAMAENAGELRQAVATAVQESADKLADEADLFRAWGIGPGELQKLDFTERAQLAARLHGSKLSKYRQLIGRFRTMASAQRARKTEYGRDELVGVELSDDLPRVLGSELAKASNRHLRLDFLNRFAERQLLARKYQGVEKIGDGAIIACVDNSGSMAAKDNHGIPRETWAKALALALLDQARSSNRDFIGINFGSQFECRVFRFPRGESDLTQLLIFAEQFYGGGTNFDRPLTEAMDVLEAEFNTAGKQRGDIVFITDGDCYVDTQFMSRYQERKKALDFRTFGVFVGKETVPPVLDALSDQSNAVVEFADPSSIASLFQQI